MIAKHLALSTSDGMCIMGPSIAHCAREHKCQREVNPPSPPSWLPSMPLRRIGTGRDSYDCPACDGFATFGFL